MRARTLRPRISGSLLGSVGRELEALDLGREDHDVLEAFLLRVQGPVGSQRLVQALRPEDRLGGLATEVARDRAAVDGRPERRVVLLPVLHHVVAVGPVLVGDAHQDLGLVLLEADLGRLALMVVADVLGDELPRAAERRIGVDDLLDREAHVVGERRPVGGELPV